RAAGRSAPRTASRTLKARTAARRTRRTSADHGRSAPGRAGRTGCSTGRSDLSSRTSLRSPPPARPLGRPVGVATGHRTGRYPIVGLFRSARKPAAPTALVPAPGSSYRKFNTVDLGGRMLDNAGEGRALGGGGGGGRGVGGRVDFDVPCGSVTGLLGPSGSGKATLMRALVGVQRIRSGEVTVLGLPAGSAALRSRVGYVTQAPSVYGDLSVRDNARYFG